MHERPQILRQTGATEGKAGLQVVGRHVQLPVLTKDSHHLPAVDIHGPADVSDFVRERDLQTVERITRVFHDLRCLGIDDVERRIDGPVELCDLARHAPIVAADECERRVVEVLQ